MPRSTIIVGNGLGMSLDPNFFKLDNAMAEVWENPDCITAVQKRGLRRCVSAQGIDDRPHGEEHLDVLHVAVIACRFLNSIASEDVTWLSADGRLFPSAIEKYITSVAWHFHHCNVALPAAFVNCLAEFLHKTESHIATLNYDNLLYQGLIESGILRGYDGALVDGFYNEDGFDAENLERKWGNTFGYYLHLHGSPLFINVNDVPRKQLQGQANENLSTPHLVLTHVKHKRSVIANSYLLTTYWDYLERGLRESEAIIIFGYSGYDTHLNEVITKYADDQPVIVIEWAGNGLRQMRKNFWREKLKGDFDLIQLENILEFTAWNDILD
jgi:hypothetical protein